MRQAYHTIIKPEGPDLFVGWVEEVPGTLTYGRSLAECRERLRESLVLMIETNRDEARLALDPTCIQEPIEIEIDDASALASI